MGDLISAILSTVDKFIPTPMTAEQKAQIQLQLLTMQQQGQLAQITSQTDTNKQEAANTSTFVAGWRPFIGWICGTGMGCNYVGISLVTTISKIVGHPVDIHPMDLSEMMPLLVGMLGLGGMRSYEKVNGVNSGK